MPTPPLYLISQDTINLYEDLSRNMKSERILNNVTKMQDLDLKLFLGHKLYYDIISHITTTVPGVIVWDVSTPAAYEDLFNGVVYDDPQGDQIAYEGLNKTMVYFTLARIIEGDALRFTATGPVFKLHDNAESLKPADITKYAQSIRSIANAHCNEVDKFLFDNKAKFTLWRYSTKKASGRQAGPRIRGVDRTNFNNINGPILGDYPNYWGLNDLL